MQRSDSHIRSLASNESLPAVTWRDHFAALANFQRMTEIIQSSIDSTAQYCDDPDELMQSDEALLHSAIVMWFPDGIATKADGILASMLAGVGVDVHSILKGAPN